MITVFQSVLSKMTDDDNNSMDEDGSSVISLTDPCYEASQAFVDHLDEWIAGVQALDPRTVASYTRLHRYSALLAIQGLTDFLLWMDGHGHAAARSPRSP